MPGITLGLVGAQRRVLHAEVAELFGVGRSIVYRAIERQRMAAKAGLAEATSKR